MSRRLILVLTVLIWSLGAQASYALTPLTRATVQQIRNIVRLQPQRQPARPARLSDPMVPGDALSTGSGSSADVVFNDGSLARLGAQALFNFKPNTRDIDLRGGTVLALIRPGQGLTRIRTPNATAGIRGSALFVRYVPETQTSIVAALTDSGITVSNEQGTQTLAAGQMAVFEGDRLQGVYEFDLSSFYATSEIVKGLDLSSENPQAIAIEGAALDEVRAEIRRGLASQGSLAEMPMQENPDFLSAVSTRTESSPPEGVPLRPTIDVHPDRLLEAGETQFLEAVPASQFEPNPVAPAQPQPAIMRGLDMIPTRPGASPAQPATPAQPNGPGTPATPATPAQPGGRNNNAATPATPARPNGPGTPATPATPAQPGGRNNNAATPATPAQPNGPGTPATPATPAQPNAGNPAPQGPVANQPPLQVDPAPDPAGTPTTPAEPPTTIPVTPDTPPSPQPEPDVTPMPVEPPISVNPAPVPESTPSSDVGIGLNLANLGINLGGKPGKSPNPPANPPDRPPGNPVFDLPGLPRQN